MKARNPIDYLRTHPFAGHLIAYTIIMCTMLVLYIDNQNETKDRVSQTCELFEGAHLNDVTQLKQTYKYIDALGPRETKDTINQFIISGLPELELKARSDPAPEYCDEPDVGLPEPDPVLPKKRDFSNLTVETSDK